MPDTSHEYALLVVLRQNVLVGPMMGDDDVDDVGDDVLSCPGGYYRFSPTLLPTRRGLKLRHHALPFRALRLQSVSRRALAWSLVISGR